MSTPIDDGPTTINAEAAPGGATDATWITFPPFPKPPPGVYIIPFKSFKPKGICVVEDGDPDAPPDPTRVERDALGIQTVTLASSHSLTQAERKKRASKKMKRVEKGSDGTMRQLMWWEDWERGEPARRTMVDPNTTRVDRLHQASHDFRSDRPWPSVASGLPQLWDQFRLYIGLISSIQPAPGVRRMREVRRAAEAEAEGGSDDDDDDDDAMDGGTKPDQKVNIIDEEQARAVQDEKIRNARPKRGPFYEEEREVRLENFREARDTRMDTFFNEMDTCVKVFFSSFYREKGLVWSEQRVRDGPILIGFWLNFLLRNRVLPEPEHEKGLRRALLVIEQARKELPQTFVIGKALPDAVGAGCEALWGSKGQTTFWPPGSDAADKAEDGTAEPDAKRRKVDDDEATELLKKVIGDAKVEVFTSATVAAIDKATGIDSTSAANTTSDGGWGSGWGPSANDTGAVAAGWDDVEDNPWAGNGGSTWKIEPQPNPLMAHLGATVLPLTHTTGVAERSTRKILSITPPTGLPVTKADKKKLKGLNEVELVEYDLSARFAKMTLAPLPAGTQSTDILPPAILESSRGPVVEDEAAVVDESADPRPHYPLKDSITVLLDSAAAANMLLGMHLGGAWVQIVRLVHGDGAEDGNGEPGKPSGFWYVEQLTSILPSYHAEATY